MRQSPQRLLSACLCIALFSVVVISLCFLFLSSNTSSWKAGSTTLKPCHPYQDLLPHLPDCNLPQSNLTLQQLAEKYKPSKFIGYSHTNYQRFYPLYLEMYRHKKFKFLEIGLDTGAGTLLWKEYFPCAELYGLEYSAKSTTTKGAKSITTIQGDQGNAEFLEGRFMEESRGGFFDVIVDDGGHHYEQQITSYRVLFEKALNPGGIYLLEDIETSYWEPGTPLYGHPVTRGGITAKTVVNEFKKVVDVVNKKFHDNSYFVIAPVDHLIATLAFGSNLIIMKKKDLEHCYAEQLYVWPERLAKNSSARQENVDVLQGSPMHKFCGDQILSRDRGKAPR